MAGNFADIRERGVKQIHFIVSDGLSGMKNAVSTLCSPCHEKHTG
ncbi:transposase [Thermospira aquatica]|uniref:Transposase n=1 Tax=Thermospira aquatica TaxID=2828656 RepID=A0AAX3BG97_9SPIR|nr:transposase [Thermospira aquatica]